MRNRKEAIALGLAATSVGLLGAADALNRHAPDERGEGLKTGSGSHSADEMTAESVVTWDLPSDRNERVDFWIEFLSGRNYEKTRLWLERVGTYGPMIQEQLAERGMPQDLLYLAMIESGLSPSAYSHAHASGMWQFIRETGERYGLSVDEYVDERNDPVKATGAALTYLTELAERFEGSWFLAAASYNTGENRVERILNERAGGVKGDDALFWKIAPHLPRETRDYVPLMIAMGHIAKQPETYGFYNVQPREPLAYDEVSVPGGTRLGAVAAAAGADVELIEELNARFTRKITPPGRSSTVRIPAGATRRFAANFGGADLAGQEFAD